MSLDAHSQVFERVCVSVTTIEINLNRYFLSYFLPVTAASSVDQNRSSVSDGRFLAKRFNLPFLEAFSRLK